MGNDRTKRPASGLKRKPCHRGGGSIDSTREFDGGGGGGSGVGGNEEFLFLLGCVQLTVFWNKKKLNSG